MDPETREVAALRSRWWALAVMSLVAAGLGAGTAWADIQVHVKNCSSMTVQANAFDAKDSVKMAASSSANLSPSGGSASLHCAGQGKGYCQMIFTIVPSSKTDCALEGSEFNLQSGKWAVVTKVVEQAAGGGKTCTLQIEQDLDSAPPSSCN